MAIPTLTLVLCVTGVAGVACLITGCLLIHFQPIIIHDGIKDNVKIDPHSASWDNWKHPSSPIYYQLWVFDLVNPDEVMVGGKPSMVQKGPYTYREKRQKFNITFTKNDTVKYRERKTYFFVPEMSAGLENDTVTFINIPVLTVLDKLKDSNIMVTALINKLLSSTGEKILATRTVGQLLWGYKDKFMTDIAEFVKAFHINTTVSGTFGLFDKSNGTDDGVYEIYTGKGDIDRVGSTASWKGKSHLDFWTSKFANMINGSDGTTYAPFVDKNTTKFIFSSDLCRSIGMDYTETVKLRGITMYRHVAPEILFANVSVNPDNAGFCTPKENCLPSGLLNVSNCHEGAPIVMSMPHFLGCDQDIIDSITGLSPNKTEHESYLDVEPNTGVVMSGQKRLQINVFVTPIKKFTQTEKLPEVYMPVVWLNESSMIDKKSAEDFKDGLFGKEELITGFKFALIGLGGFLMMAVGFVLVLSKFRKTIKYSRFDVNTDESDVVIT